jgi:hypothetical protein
MAKQNGLGDNFYVGSYDLSGDVSALGTVGGSVGVLDKTGINKFGYERIGGLRTGNIEFNTHFNDAAGQEHVALSALPTTDVIMTYFRGTTLGNPAASMVAKQINYDASRGDDGDLTFAVSAQSNGFGLEWGRSLTAGLRTDTAATNGTAIDTTASASFGAQAYLHVTAFTGTDCTITVEDSADNITFATVDSFTVVSGVTSERNVLGTTTETLDRYVRVSTTAGTFSSITFAVNLVKNTAAVSF